MPFGFQPRKRKLFSVSASREGRKRDFLHIVGVTHKNIHRSLKEQAKASCSHRGHQDACYGEPARRPSVLPTYNPQQLAFRNIFPLTDSVIILDFQNFQGTKLFVLQSRLFFFASKAWCITLWPQNSPWGLGIMPKWSLRIISAPRRLHSCILYLAMPAVVFSYSDMWNWCCDGYCHGEAKATWSRLLPKLSSRI